MGEKLQYVVEITVDDYTDKDAIDTGLQDLLLDLYDYAAINQIHVIDRTQVEDENMNAIFDLLEDIEAEDVMRSVELVREMERQGDEDE